MQLQVRRIDGFAFHDPGDGAHVPTNRFHHGFAVLDFAIVVGEGGRGHKANAHQCGAGG